MDKYRLVQELKADESLDFLGDSGVTDSGGWNYPEVRITQQGKPRNYISYALQLFSDGSHTIVLKAMGRAINKAVTIAEIIKRKLPVHQLNQLSSVEMIDVYTPLEEGLEEVTSRRYVSCMRITLSLSATTLDSSHYGYQPPLPKDEMSPPMPPQQHGHHVPHYHHFSGGGGGAATPQHYLMSPHA